MLAATGAQTGAQTGPEFNFEYFGQVCNSLILNGRLHAYGSNVGNVMTQLGRVMEEEEGPTSGSFLDQAITDVKSTAKAISLAAKAGIAAAYTAGQSITLSPFGMVTRTPLLIKQGDTSRHVSEFNSGLVGLVGDPPPEYVRNFHNGMISGVVCTFILDFDILLNLVPRQPGEPSLFDRYTTYLESSGVLKVDQNPSTVSMNLDAYIKSDSSPNFKLILTGLANLEIRYYVILKLFSLLNIGEDIIVYMDGRVPTVEPLPTAGRPNLNGRIEVLNYISKFKRLTVDMYNSHRAATRAAETEASNPASPQFQDLHKPVTVMIKISPSVAGEVAGIIRGIQDNQIQGLVTRCELPPGDRDIIHGISSDIEIDAETNLVNYRILLSFLSSLKGEDNSIIYNYKGIQAVNDIGEEILDPNMLDDLKIPKEGLHGLKQVALTSGIDGTIFSDPNSSINFTTASVNKAFLEYLSREDIKKTIALRQAAAEESKILMKRIDKSGDAQQVTEVVSDATGKVRSVLGRGLAPASSLGRGARDRASSFKRGAEGKASSLGQGARNRASSLRRGMDNLGGQAKASMESLGDISGPRIDDLGFALDVAASSVRDRITGRSSPVTDLVSSLSPKSKKESSGLLKLPKRKKGGYVKRTKRKIKRTNRNVKRTNRKTKRTNRKIKRTNLKIKRTKRKNSRKTKK